jgi:hypothetical protein
MPVDTASVPHARGAPGACPRRRFGSPHLQLTVWKARARSRKGRQPPSMPWVRSCRRCSQPHGTADPQALAGQWGESHDSGPEVVGGGLGLRESLGSASHDPYRAAGRRRAGFRHPQHSERAHPGAPTSTSVSESSSPHRSYCRPPPAWNRRPGQPPSGALEGSKGRPEAAPSRSRASRRLASSGPVPSLLERGLAQTRGEACRGPICPRCVQRGRRPEWT